MVPSVHPSLLDISREYLISANEDSIRYAVIPPIHDDTLMKHPSGIIPTEKADFRLSPDGEEIVCIKYDQTTKMLVVLTQYVDISIPSVGDPDATRF
jgi:hypothetical protein